MTESYSRNKNGNLSFFGQDLVNLASIYGTPLYVFSEQKIINNILSIRNAFNLAGCGHFDIAYPLKANSLLEIVKVLNNLGTKFEVCSEEEIFRCYQLSVNPSKILYSNVVKPKSAIEMAVKYGTSIAIDSLADYENISKTIRSLGLERIISVFVRVNPQLEEISSSYTSGTYQGKFGLLPDEIMSLIKIIIADNLVKPIGLQIHLASQILDPNLYMNATSLVIRLIKDIEQKYSQVKIQYLDFGGGFPVNYHHDKENINYIPYADNIIKPIVRAGLNDRTIMIEPGRATISNAGVLLLSASTIKKHPTQGEFVVVDASIYSVLMDAIFFDWYFEIEIANNRQTNGLSPKWISGNTSDSSDVLGRWKSLKCNNCGNDILEPLIRAMPAINSGDILAVKDAGAYTISFNNNFCGSLKPPVILITKEGSIHLIRRAESMAESLRLELPVHLD